MDKRQSELLHRFRQQEQFSENYSPLYASIFGTVATWLAQDPPDHVSSWLLDITKDRPAFDVTNLLAAGLHWEVLQKGGVVSELSQFYPTVGGDSSILNPTHQQTKDTIVSLRFEQALRTAILGRQHELRAFIQTFNVQTNETGRGIVWLLPTTLGSLSPIHLVDLGASAGLNLAAEQRAYRFVDEKMDKTILKLGFAKEDQFFIHSQGHEDNLLTGKSLSPVIHSRLGCDVRPFPLATAADEQILTSFVWADQLYRFQRLREGIDALHLVNSTQAPVKLHQVNLPLELPSFLENNIEISKDPLVIYNTYIKMYLPQKGVLLRKVISDWAVDKKRPVIWLQWEPSKFIDIVTEDDPEFGWLAWTADLWLGREHQQWQLGWVHPHGQFVYWLSGIRHWIEYWQSFRNQTIIR